MRTKYLVIVYPAQPNNGDISRASTAWHSSNGPTVKTVTASTPQEAANTAGVPAGGHSLVTKLEAMDRFDRAAQAPLVRKMADGSPMPELAHA